MVGMETTPHLVGDGDHSSPGGGWGVMRLLLLLIVRVRLLRNAYITTTLIHVPVIQLIACYKLYANRRLT